MTLLCSPYTVLWLPTRHCWVRRTMSYGSPPDTAGFAVHRRMASHQTLLGSPYTVLWLPTRHCWVRRTPSYGSPPDTAGFAVHRPMATHQTLLGSPYTVLWLPTRHCWVRRTLSYGAHFTLSCTARVLTVRRRMSADVVFCHCLHGEKVD